MSTWVSSISLKSNDYFNVYISTFLRPAMLVSYITAPLWLLHVRVDVRVFALCMDGHLRGGPRTDS